VRRIVSGIGKVLITLGLLILLFVGYQLWGTGIYTARQQNALEKEFQAAIEATGTTPTSLPAPTRAGTGVTTTLPPPSPPAPDDSEVVAHLVIPKIGVDAYVVQGTNDSDLRKGPGHYPSTVYPGQRGNAAIAGHRTTYGAPFGPLDDLEVGDVVQVTTLQGSFSYQVYDKFVVAPTDREVLDVDPARSAILTLTTCNPKYSAAERLIVRGELLPIGAQPLPSTVKPRDSAADRAPALSDDSGSIVPTLFAGLLLALIGALWWLVFHRHPRWTTWLIGAVPFAIALSVFYYLFERVLPSNY
jgi:sortase A